MGVPLDCSWGLTVTARGNFRWAPLSQGSRTEPFGGDVPLNKGSKQGSAAVAINALPASVRTTHCSGKLVSPALVTPPAGAKLASGFEDWLHLMGLLLYRPKPTPRCSGGVRIGDALAAAEKSNNQDPLLRGGPVSATTPGLGPHT